MNRTVAALAALAVCVAAGYVDSNAVAALNHASAHVASPYQHLMSIIDGMLVGWTMWTVLKMLACIVRSLACHEEKVVLTQEALRQHEANMLDGLERAFRKSRVPRLD